MNAKTSPQVVRIGTFARSKAEAFAEIASAVGLPQMSSVVTYFPDAYNMHLEDELVETLSAGDWSMLIKAAVETYDYPLI